MRYTLILGGTGFIGSNLVYEYIKRDKNVIILGTSYTTYNKHFNDIVNQITIINGRLCNISLLNKVFEQYEIEEVIHLVSGLKPSSLLEEFLNEYEEVIIPTIKLIEIMNKHNVRKLIYLSSGGTVYGNYRENGCYKEDDLLQPINYYGLSKCNLEEIIKLEGRKGTIDYLILRPSNPFGKFQNINGQQGLIAVLLGKVLVKQEIEIWGDGSVVRDYIPIEYLCQCIIKLSELKIKNEIYNIGSGIGLSVNEIIQIVEKSLKIKLKIQYKEARSVDLNKVILNIDKLKRTMDVDKFVLDKSILKFYDFILEENDDN
ncbi:UDP-glucose 4-epimerase [Propionispira arboris]|uniref:UDP-glucose 4-epimerase n=1 Tax=Propionispira arboris TaxID=84035 RepID=A0A1H6TXM0_9FIRM|nr:NAD-dependent epimerase/dehydratase family protein [Propionispira arboris]SEI84751.1 UDP-glucose 4-epimerase [Propionispira arboris]